MLFVVCQKHIHSKAEPAKTLKVVIEMDVHDVVSDVELWVVQVVFVESKTWL